MSLEGKVVLITGAGRGIGAGIARCFADRGALVAVTDLDQTMADESAAALVTRAIGIAADASSQQAMGEAYDKVVAELGGLDVVVNNAGIGGLDLTPEELSSGDPGVGMTDDEWDEQLKYNLRTTYASSNAAISPTERWRQHRQHRLHRRTCRHARSDGLRRGQGGCGAPDQVAGDAAGTKAHTGELHLPRPALDQSLGAAHRPHAGKPAGAVERAATADFRIRGREHDAARWRADSGRHRQSGGVLCLDEAG